MKYRITLALLAAALCTTPVFAADHTQSITVTANESVTVTPDLATIEILIENTESSFNEALMKTETKMKEIMNDLEDPMLAKSLSNSGVSVNPNYDYSTEDYMNNILSYTGNVTISVNEVALDDISKILELAKKNNINRISSLQYSYSNYDEAYDQALTEAIGKAKEKAQVIAAGADGTIGSLLSAVEGYQDQTYRTQYAKTDVNVMDAAGVSEELAVSGSGDSYFHPGEIVISAAITAEYAFIEE